MAAETGIGARTHYQKPSPATGRPPEPAYAAPKTMRIPRFLDRLKPVAKRLRHRARSAYVKRFHSFTPADLGAALRRLGVVEGDVLCIHSSFDRFLGFTGGWGEAVRALQHAVGEKGGILMPTQPFTSTAVEYVRTHPVTDIRRAPSRMGLLTEILRRSPGVIRSISPTHPVAAWGERGIGLLGNDWEAATPCGRGTAYHRLLETDGKILFLGTPVHTMTFYHCVEEIIEPMMPFSPFTAERFALTTRDAKGALYTSHMRLFEPAVSNARRADRMEPELKRRGFWREGKVSRLEMILVRTTDVLDTCRSMASQGRFLYDLP
jgi:aminoglycoside 3-N-acetyltransferase